LQENGGFFFVLDFLKKLLQKVEVTGYTTSGEKTEKAWAITDCFKGKKNGAQVGTFVCQNKRVKPTLCGSHVSCVY
jgi:hypothetical protein